MNIDKSKSIYVLDLDNKLYNKLKDIINIKYHSNLMMDVINTKVHYDILLTDILFKDGDIIELCKHIDITPICLATPTKGLYNLLSKRVDFISLDDFLKEDEYIDLSSSLEGYNLTLRLLKELSMNEMLLGELNTLYAKIGNPKTVEKNVRYYKENLFDRNVLFSNTIKFNKSYPTNSEFFRLLLELYKAKKIKVD